MKSEWNMDKKKKKKWKKENEEKTKSENRMAELLAGRK